MDGKLAQLKDSQRGHASPHAFSVIAVWVLVGKTRRLVPRCDWPGRQARIGSSERSLATRLARSVPANYRDAGQSEKAESRDHPRGLSRICRREDDQFQPGQAHEQSCGDYLGRDTGHRRHCISFVVSQGSEFTISDGRYGPGSSHQREERFHSDRCDTGEDRFPAVHMATATSSWRNRHHGTCDHIRSEGGRLAWSQRSLGRSLPIVEISVLASLRLRFAFWELYS